MTLCDWTTGLGMVDGIGYDSVPSFCESGSYSGIEGVAICICGLFFLSLNRIKRNEVFTRYKIH